MRLRLLLLLATWALAGCAVGPNYHRPPVNVPPEYRGATPVATPASTTSLGNEKWWEVFGDPALQKLIRAALAQNYDVRIAAQRVLEAQAEAGITRSEEFPSVSAGASIFGQHNPKINSVFPSYSSHAGQLNASVIWNLDFWGKYRRQTEAARDQWLASEWGRRAVANSVVSEVAAGYFQLRELDLALDISRQTLASRQDAYRLTKVLADNGSASELDLSQAEELVDTAAEDIPELERQIAQQENLISLLTGQSPGSIPRGGKLTEQVVPGQVPAGLPSELLERRPDIREAEANLMAANANMGAAKAEFFPSLSLTATGGLESYALNRFFSTQSGLWSEAASLSQPIFQAGALRAGLQYTQAQKQQMLIAYQQAIAEALREVSDALIAYQKDREYREQQQKLTSAAAEADRLSQVLYHNGGASYLQVLTAESNHFAADLNLAQAQLNEHLALVQLYNALGGGWQ